MSNYAIIKVLVKPNDRCAEARVFLSSENKAI